MIKVVKSTKTTSRHCVEIHGDHIRRFLQAEGKAILAECILELQTR